ncbi:MAG: hypothetical protein ABF743_12905 [Schleiferilactobacillus perolens]|nr:hypothetical protein [Schleiferilactobacillus perolens]
MPTRSNRRLKWAQLWKPHRALFARMWLGVFETAHFAGSNRRHSVPAHFSRRLRSFGTAHQEKNCSNPIFSRYAYRPRRTEQSSPARYASQLSCRYG